MSIEIQLEDFEIEKHDKNPEELEKPFSEVEPDTGRLQELKDHDYDNLVVIGNGGSITSFRALYYFFIDQVDMGVELVTTQEPDYLNRVSRNNPPENTLVMPVSKSGTTSSVLDATLYFLEKDYDLMPVTSDNAGVLRQIVERRDLEWIEHRDVGGRFSGATETALAPAAVAGLDVEEIRRGAEKGYERFEGESAAWEVAEALYTAERDGYSEVLAPFYSSRMFGFYPLFVQLMHETVCKEGNGQTVTGDLGPEIQHHTNQRLFGGRSDMVPFFFTADSHEKKTIDVPDDLQDIEVKGHELSDFKGIEYAEALEYEYTGVKQALEEEGVPRVFLNLQEHSYGTAGELLAFLQYLAAYSAYLRDVGPYNQPDVEKSKNMAFEQRFEE
jgi:glucose-6-phosphate isomerase